MAVWHDMEPERLRADRQLRYATPAIRPVTSVQQQDMEICNPCPTTFLLPISPAAHSLTHIAQVRSRWTINNLVNPKLLPRLV